MDDLSSPIFTSIINLNTMATFKLKSKTFSAPESSRKVYRLQRIYAEGEGEKKGMSTGAKVGLGIAGTALGAGAALMGARGGLFGAKAMKATNTMIKNAGTALKGDGKGMLSNLGTKMEASGNYRVGKADQWLRGGKIRAGQKSVLAGKNTNMNWQMNNVDSATGQVWR